MSNTEHRSYPKPVPAHNVSDDVVLLQQALDAVDGDINLLFAAIADLAPISHEHVIADIQGLSSALAGKANTSHTHSLDDLSDVAGASVGATGYLLVKQADGSWGPASPASVVGAHEHVIADVQNLQTALDGLAMNAQILGATDTTLADADHWGFRRFSGGALIKRTTLQVMSYFFSKLGVQIAGGTAKATPVDADAVGYMDSAASNATKIVTFTQMWVNYFKGKADALYLLAANVVTAAQYRANTAGKVLTTDQVWSAAAPVNLGATLTGNLTLDLSSGFNFYGTATGNIVFNAVTNPKSQSGTIELTASGADRTVGLTGAAFSGVGVTIPSGQTWLFSYFYRQGGKVHLSVVARAI